MDPAEGAWYVVPSCGRPKGPFPDLYVDYTEIHASNLRRTELPAGVEQRIRDFDNPFQTVEPFAFEIDLPVEPWEERKP